MDGRYLSVRIERKTVSKAGGQNAHDLRRGSPPDYVDPGRTHRNSVLIEPVTGRQLRQECERRRSTRNMQRAMRGSAAVGMAGIITFSTQAQNVLAEVSVEEQDRRFLETAQQVAEAMGTTLTGLVVHRDESAIHAHFQCPAYRLDGEPLSNHLNPAALSQLQDVAATAWEDLGIERGEKKAAKIERLREEGKSQQEILAQTVHRSVRELHWDLPAERERLQGEILAKRREIEELVAKAEKNRRLTEEQRQKLEAGKVDLEKAQKRIETYTRREQAAIAAKEKAEAYLKTLIADMRAKEVPPLQAEEVRVLRGLHLPEKRVVVDAGDAREWQRGVFRYAAGKIDANTRAKRRELEEREKQLAERERRLEEQERQQQERLREQERRAMEQIAAREREIERREKNAKKQEIEARARVAQLQEDAKAAEKRLEELRMSLQAMAGEMGRGIEALGQGLRENDLIPSEEGRRLESIGNALMNGASPLSLEPKEIRELGYTVCNLGIWMRDELRNTLKIDQQQQEQLRRVVPQPSRDPGPGW